MSLITQKSFQILFTELFQMLKDSAVEPYENLKNKTKILFFYLLIFFLLHVVGYIQQTSLNGWEENLMMLISCMIWIWDVRLVKRLGWGKETRLQTMERAE